MTTTYTPISVPPPLDPPSLLTLDGGDRRVDIDVIHATQPTLRFTLVEFSDTSGDYSMPTVILIPYQETHGAFTGMPAGTWYARAKSIDVWGNQSAYCDEETADSTDSGGGGGGGGGGTAVDYDVSPNPDAHDDEFKTSLSGWTNFGSLTTLLGDTPKSNVYMFSSATGAFNLHGMYKTAPSMPFTVTIKLSDIRLDSNFQQYGICLAEASPGKYFVWGPTYQSTNGIPEYVYAVWTNRTSRSGTIAESGAVGKWPQAPWHYVRLIVTSSTSVACQYSYDGIVWHTLFSGINPGFTVANVGVFLSGNDNSTAAECAIDWIRFGTDVVQSEAVLWQNAGALAAELTDISTTETDTTKVLMPDGAGATRWAAGGMVLLEEHIASASSSLDFTAMSSVFDEYVFECFNLQPANDSATLMGRLSTNAGSSYDATAANYHGGSHYTRMDSSGSGDNSGRTTPTGAYLTDSYGTAQPGITGRVTLYNASAAVWRQFIYQFTGTGAGGGAYYTQTGAANWKSTSQANAIRFLFDNGNIASGTIRMYGVSK